MFIKIELKICYFDNPKHIQSLYGEPTLEGYRYKVVVDQFPITDKVVDVLGVQSSHAEVVTSLVLK